MRQTVVGVFDSDAEAQRAAQALSSTGIDPACVHVTHGDDTTLGSSAATTTTTTHETGVMGRVRNFFADLFGPDDEREVGHYAEAVRRGAAVVKVDVEDETRLDQVRDALQNAGAVDIDERVESWRAQGWSDEDLGGTSTAAAATNATLERDQTTLGENSAGITGTTGSTAGLRATGTTEDVIPVVREDIQIGKRAVSTGGVRVYSRTVETPVSETVQLREEHAQVERRPVDRPATAADLADLKDRTIEVVETAEQAVVQKTARVVEEVRVGKTVEQRTEQVTDTVRSTEVEVEHIPGTGTVGAFDSDYYRNDFNTRFAAEGGRYEDYEPAYRYGHSLRSDPRYADRSWDEFEADARRDYETRYPGGTWERMKAAVRRGWERTKDAVTPDSMQYGSAYDDDYYRRDWQTNYGTLGGRYEDYEPAYRYGHTLRSDARYTGRDWDAIEPDVRRDWETRYPGSTWERMKGAVRRGWDRMTS
ncbi:YsnF/AvaK domain-containing protein [Azohydromonas caseinilytica]|uniref:YsnF/AvaK domain-containing protein n=1 Tax=Azohydromonas caseinilytica TaxID=2728836 RepID=UPI001F303790|nr:YsnF/AvaK domain-containing protein [Azohydromonas caseinilytica]